MFVCLSLPCHLCGASGSAESRRSLGRCLPSGKLAPSGEEPLRTDLSLLSFLSWRLKQSELAFGWKRFSLSVCCLEFLSLQLHLLFRFPWFGLRVFLLVLEALFFLDLEFCFHQSHRASVRSLTTFSFVLSLEMTTFVVCICRKNERAGEM